MTFFDRIAFGAGGLLLVMLLAALVFAALAAQPLVLSLVGH